MPASARIGNDSITMRRRIGRPLAPIPDDRGADTDRDARDRDDRRDRWNAEQVGREEQARQRDHVARGGDDRRGDVVEVEVAVARRTRRPRP